MTGKKAITKKSPIIQHQYKVTYSELLYLISIIFLGPGIFGIIILIIVSIRLLFDLSDLLILLAHISMIMFGAFFWPQYRYDIKLYDQYISFTPKTWTAFYRPMINLNYSDVARIDFIDTLTYLNQRSRNLQPLGCSDELTL